LREAVFGMRVVDVLREEAVRPVSARPAGTTERRLP
jgi:uncharacterized DUF497 family protein